MTYLHRLAKRIAGLRRVACVALLAGLACSKGEKVGFLSPDPNPTQPKAFSLRVEPLIASVRSGTEVQFTATGYSLQGELVPVVVDWTAQGGTIEPDGRFIGGPAGQYSVVARIRNQANVADSARVSVWENDHELVELIVFPDSAAVEEGDSLRATAAFRLANGDLTQEASVVWSADGGAIDTNGVFSAPTTGAYMLTAQSSVGLRGRATVLVHPRWRRVERISLNPPATTLVRGTSATFDATAYYSSGPSGPADVAWSATGGSISSTGRYVAGGQSGNYVVVARERNSGFVDTAVVAVLAPNVVRLALSPKTLAINPGATRQFSALAQMSDGRWQAVPMTWSAGAGSITSTGLFTAPSQPGTYSVIVASSVHQVADTAAVIVTQPAATLTSVRINPTSASMGVGESREFVAVADWSDGSTSTPSVTWTATGGTVNTNGVYVAGSAPGAFRVIGTAPGGKADTSEIVITTPVLTGLALTPGLASVQTGATVQFAVAGTWSDGGNGSPVVAWDVSGGTMSGNGLFNAGSQPGTFSVIASAMGGALADTAFVTVTSPAATLNGLLLTPSSGVLPPGGSMDFNVIGTWSNGANIAPPVTYTVTGGTMDGKRYTAGSAPGTYRVIAKHTGGVKADTSSVVITNPVTLSTLWVSPENPSVAPGGSVQFGFAATWSNGSTALPLVSWTAAGGTITTTGKYTAGSTPGNYKVILAHQGGTRRDTANVTVLGVAPPPPPPPPAATLTSLTVSPDPVSVTVATTKQFTVTGSWSDGSTSVPVVTWTATGGTISSSGMYTAGVLPGSYRVIAKQQGGTKADTAAVTVAVGLPPVVTSLVITPGNTSMQAGTSQVFSVLGNLSGGGTGPVSVNWTATGGTITSSGAFTAGSNAGAYYVRATLLGGIITATVNVNISVPSTSGCTGGSNQPAGFFAIVGRRFNSLGNGTNGRGTGSFPCKTGGSEGFDDAESRYSNTGSVQDGTAPISASGVLRFMYPAQTVPTGGTFNPGVVQTMSFTGSTYGQRLYRKMYLRTAFRVSPNWQGHSTSTNKLIFFRANGSTHMEPILRLRGSGSNALILNVDLQGSPRDPRTNTGGLNPNTAGAAAAGAFNMQRGQWYNIEVVLEVGQNGAANGKLKIWVNGVLTHNYSDIEYEPTSTGTWYWDTLHVAPTWGGQGGTINQTMWLDYDEFFISGAP